MLVLSAVLLQVRYGRLAWQESCAPGKSAQVFNFNDGGLGLQFKHNLTMFKQDFVRTTELQIQSDSYNFDERCELNLSSIRLHTRGACHIQLKISDSEYSARQGLGRVAWKEPSICQSTSPCWNHPVSYTFPGWNVTGKVVTIVLTSGFNCDLPYRRVNHSSRIWDGVTLFARGTYMQFNKG